MKRIMKDAFMVCWGSLEDVDSKLEVWVNAKNLPQMWALTILLNGSIYRYDEKDMYISVKDLKSLLCELIEDTKGKKRKEYEAILSGLKLKEREIKEDILKNPPSRPNFCSGVSVEVHA